MGKGGSHGALACSIAVPTHEPIMYSESRTAPIGSTTHSTGSEAAQSAEAIARLLVSTSFKLSCATASTCAGAAGGAAPHGRGLFWQAC